MLLPTIRKKNRESKSSYKAFTKENCKESTVLIVEPNPYHFEILPGFVNYFQLLGYKVEIMAQPVITEDSPFVKFSSQPKIYTLSAKYQKKALGLENINKYDFVFLSSSVLWADNIRDSYLNWLGFIPNSKNGVLLVEHNVIPYLKDYKHDRFLNQNRLFTLAGQENTPMLNPHYFGEIPSTNKSNENIFVAVVNTKENIDLLYSACRKLISENITNFKLKIAGRTAVNQIPSDLENYISLTGFITFKELWDIYKNADYLIPMLNPEISHHIRFKSGSVTGSWQIMLGFKKPMIIHKDYCNYYRLNEENAIIYNANSQMYKAIKEGINLSDKKYNMIQHHIEHLAKDISEMSLLNLRNSIEAIVSNPL
ncbi:hypothetical protein [Empedobacter falsenii]|uniref:Glycosyltransferase family 1 protein n=1 Tax=Empedobacter falsenii TaxID=343874 RepID=A0ABY8VEA5_9FLAO|nr:hypothetical protein [Empedobacter falsenii]WIH98574.1 hypothetical protein OBA43_06505 [Empedobacter falsenii]